ncbi:MAG: ABC transporter ATP-binding protein [Aigarchaeota archaeon]|nr:ABC transporter ATP-binding protein [Aigarchaeota archaeon]MCX8193411.1 ABC transporter ATP-binding protein [Nitrososphaeria archaeon]MDW7985941.1 ABC transporter ATP-binding protein [Nitrososphaerota archaeon]
MDNKNTAQLLVLKNINKVFRYGFFGFEFKALDKVNLTIEHEGIIYTIAGESGSGKTTLARIILGVHKPDEGLVEYKGKNIHSLKSSEARWFRREVQAIFQDPYATFNPMKKVYSYLYETVRSFLGFHDESEINEYINSRLLSIGLKLDDVKEKYPHEFSGGELQRIAIAKSLLTMPKLIIADEPVSMLDASFRINILNLFKDLKRRYNISFLYITHDLATAYYISDFIAILYRGTIVERGPTEDILRNPLHPYTQILLDSLPEPDPKKRDKYMKPLKLSEIEEKEFTVQGCKFSFRCSYSNEKCLQTRPPEILINNRVISCWLYHYK